MTKQTKLNQQDSLLRKVGARALSNKGTEFQGGGSIRSNLAEVTEEAFLKDSAHKIRTSPARLVKGKSRSQDLPG